MQVGCPQQTASLFDHLVGDGEHPWRDPDAERREDSNVRMASRLKVDDKLEFGRLRDREDQQQPRDPQTPSRDRPRPAVDFVRLEATVGPWFQAPGLAQLVIELR